MFLFEILDEQLDREILFYQKILTMLVEEKEKRGERKNHQVVTFTPVKGKPGIAQVECSCGKVTKYRKPLKVIEDFECPNLRRKHG